MTLADRLIAIDAELSRRVIRDTGAVVILGRRAKIAEFKPPLVWIYPEEVVVNDVGFGLQEQWDLTFWIIGIVREVKDVPAGRRDAMTLALKASGAVLKNDTGGWDRHLNSLVELMSRIGWSPADVRVSDTDESLVGAAVRIKCKLTNGEVC